MLHRIPLSLLPIVQSSFLNILQNGNLGRRPFLFRKEMCTAIGTTVYSEEVKPLFAGGQS